MVADPFLTLVSGPEREHTAVVPFSPLEQARDVTVQAYLADADSREAVLAAFRRLGLTAATVQAGGAAKATRVLDGGKSPAVLLVDLSGHDMEASALEDLAAVCEPTVTVIAVGERNDIGLYRRLKSMGVSEYLYKPLSPDLLEGALMVAMGNRSGSEGRRLGRLVMVCGPRGGAGASTLSVNLAALLAKGSARKTALVDLDMRSGTLALMLNAKPNQGLGDALASPQRVDALFLQRAMVQVSDNLGLLVTDHGLLRSEALNPAALATVVAKVRSLHHFTVVDVPSAAIDAARPALANADMRVVACDGTLGGTRDAARMREMLRGDGGPEPVIVMTRAGAPDQLAPKDLQRLLGAKPDYALPYAPGPLAEASALGEPVVDRSTRYKRAMADLARNLTGRGTPKRSFLQRMFGR